ATAGPGGGCDRAHGDRARGGAVTSFMLTSTTASKIDAHLMKLRHQMGAPAIGMVLTLIVVADEARQYDAVRAATEAAREHPSRILVVIPRDDDEGTRL